MRCNLVPSHKAYRGSWAVFFGVAGNDLVNLFCFRTEHSNMPLSPSKQDLKGYLEHYPARQKNIANLRAGQKHPTEADTYQGRLRRTTVTAGSTSRSSPAVERLSSEERSR